LASETKLSGLSYVVVCVILILAVFVELLLVTHRRKNGQTDRRTDTRWQHIPHYHSSGGKTWPQSPWNWSDCIWYVHQ